MGGVRTFKYTNTQEALFRLVSEQQDWLGAAVWGLLNEPMYQDKEQRKHNETK